jgi:hypothetical protein
VIFDLGATRISQSRGDFVRSSSPTVCSHHRCANQDLAFARVLLNSHLQTGMARMFAPRLHRTTLNCHS